MNKDILLFIVFLIGLGVVWYSTGGPARVEPDEGLFQASDTRQNTNGSPFLREATDVTKSTREIEREIRNVERSLREAQEELERLERIGTPSPHFGMVLIAHRTNGFREEIADREYVLLEAERGNSYPLTITGWQLESLQSGYRVTIGSGTALPRPGQVTAAAPITLTPGQKAVVSTGYSPIGTSFKTNLCTGYFDQFKRFSPSLTKQCPHPENEFDAFAPLELQQEKTDRNNDDDPDCRDFIDDLPRCEVVLGDLEAVEPRLTGECKAFITEELTYEGCLANHQREYDFFGNEWRVFLNSRAELWGEEHDVIRLLDHNGQTVDVFTY